MFDDGVEDADEANVGRDGHLHPIHLALELCI